MSDYDKFAKQYSDSMSEQGDYFHQTQIDPYIYSIIGDPKGKVIYDIGCGNGYMARNLVSKGAKVFASDISGALVKDAKSKSQDLDIQFSTHDAIDFSNYRDEQFDIVVMNMVVHYVQDLEKLFQGIAKILKKDGVLAFSTSHFFRPSHPYSEWVLGKINDEEKLFIKVTGYLEKRVAKVKSGWDEQTELTIYNHPLNELVNTMSKYALFTFRVEEPESVGFAKDFSEELQKSHHIPTFITIGAKKTI